jgi:hypothetical protein
MTFGSKVYVVERLHSLCEQQLNRRYIMSNVTKYQVVIQRHAVYTVEAESREDAEDLAWDMFSGDDLCEPLVGYVSEVDND